MLSRLRKRVLRVFGSPELRPVDAAIAFALAQVFFTSLFALLLYGTLSQPDVAGLDKGFIERAWRVQTLIIVPFNIGLVLVGLLVRNSSSGNLVLPHLSMQFTMLVGLWGAYLQGPYTQIFGVSVLFGVSILGLAFFTVQVVRPAVITFALGLIAITVAEQVKLIPYAPLYSGHPVQGGQLNTRFLLLSGLLPMFVSVALVLLLVAITQRLRRATTVIRRYVPVQLAERILAGEHEETRNPERRRVTLFFSDVVGFTQVADRMEPEELSALLNSYLREMAEIADAYGATINQFVGDGIMIFFGAPEATTDEDHALRAVKMALAMQKRMSELQQRWFSDGIERPFLIRVGINTGTASVGDFGSAGRTTYSAIGNQTNLTARIQAACEPGRVLISHTTWALVKDHIPCKERGEIQVRGLHYPVRVYEVLGDASQPSQDS